MWRHQVHETRGYFSKVNISPAVRIASLLEFLKQNFNTKSYFCAIVHMLKAKMLLKLRIFSGICVGFGRYEICCNAKHERMLQCRLVSKDAERIWRLHEAASSYSRGIVAKKTFFCLITSVQQVDAITILFQSFKFFDPWKILINNCFGSSQAYKFLVPFTVNNFSRDWALNYNSNH